MAIDDDLAHQLIWLVLVAAWLGTYPLGAALHQRLLALHARGGLDRPPVARHGLFFERVAWLPYVLGRSPGNTPDRKALILARTIKGLYLVILIAMGLSVWIGFGRPPLQMPQLPPPDRPAETNSKPAGWFPKP